MGLARTGPKFWRKKFFSPFPVLTYGREGQLDRTRFNGRIKDLFERKSFLGGNGTRSGGGLTKGMFTLSETSRKFLSDTASNPTLQEVP